MASAFTHAIASLAIGKVVKLVCAANRKEKGVDWKFWLLGMFCAAIPDIDAIGYKLGVPYNSFWGHRGITHSFFFALLLAIAVMLLFYKNEKQSSKRWWWLFIFFFLATALHPILDAMTTGGLGVAFFSPFENSRYFFAFRPIKVSPIGVAKFFSHRGVEVIKSEIIWVWIPCLIIFITALIADKLFSKRGFV